MLRIGALMRTGAPRSSAACASSISLRSRMSLILWSCGLAAVDRRVVGGDRLGEQLGEVEALGLPVLDHLALVEHLHLADHLVEGAIAHRGHQLAHLLGDEEEEVDDVLGLAGEAFARSTGSCVATPTGQVLRWHLRIMMQPAAIRGAVEKPNSSAPSSAPITTSRPVRMPPSTCTAMRLRSRLATSVWWVSASPISHGEPACLSEVRGEAPVPPSKPEMVT